VAAFEAWHAGQPDRWEFIGGQPRLMAPASMQHTIIKNNAGFAFRQALADQECTALVDGAQILTDDISAIPDVVVTCAPIDLETPAIAEPVIIIEVMSPSSVDDDTGRKWLSYRKIASLKWRRTSAWCMSTAARVISGASASSARAASPSTTRPCASIWTRSTPEPRWQHSPALQCCFFFFASCGPLPHEGGSGSSADTCDIRQAPARKVSFEVMADASDFRSRTKQARTIQDDVRERRSTLKPEDR
jgi:hypothetical protein